MDVRLFSRIYPPYPGGGSEYMRWLEAVLGRAGAAPLRVVTETHPQRRWRDRSGAAVVHRTLLSASNYAGPPLVRYLRYGVQNLQHLGLLRFLLARRPRVLWFHGAFFINPGVLPGVLWLLKRVRPRALRLVLDLRDPVIPDRRFARLTSFDAVIACSQRIARKLARCGVPDACVWEIPVPLRSAPPDQLHELQVAARADLKAGTYFLAPNGIREEKAFPRAFRLWKRLRAMGYPHKLVVAGRVVHWRDEYLADWRAGDLVLLGELANREVRALMRGAALVLTIGEREGMPRSALEAIEAGAPVALPPGVPEFQASDPDLVIESDDADAVARVVEIVENRRLPRYDIGRHLEDRVEGEYRQLLAALGGED
jgi:glycosyltransferase involved in cell wall biosynthesis